jgi:hypothetical protein
MTVMIVISCCQHINLIVLSLFLQCPLTRSPPVLTTPTLPLRCHDSTPNYSTVLTQHRARPAPPRQNLRQPHAAHLLQQQGPTAGRPHLRRVGPVRRRTGVRDPPGGDHHAAEIRHRRVRLDLYLRPGGFHVQGRDDEDRVPDVCQERWVGGTDCGSSYLFSMLILVVLVVDPLPCTPAPHLTPFSSHSMCLSLRTHHTPSPS